MTSPITVVPVVIDHRFVPGDDLGSIVCDHLVDITWPDGSRGLVDGDIVVITSKVVAKAEGRIVEATNREQAIGQQAVRVVARKQTPRGETTIAQTSDGLVLAAAGVDASNTEQGTVVLLPADSDASAARLRLAIEEATGAGIGVVITDTMGRPWRLGVTDMAIGASGVSVLDDFTGRVDAYGNRLEMTVVAIADEIASAVELATGKLAGAPLAVVRGLAHHLTTESVGARDVVRPLDEDLFWLGTAEALAEGAKGAVSRRRTIRHFTDQPVARDVIDRAIEDAVLAPAPHHSEPFRFIVLRSDHEYETEQRSRLLDAMKEAWIADLREIDRKADDEIERRVARGNLLRTAPVVIIPIVDLAEGAHTYADPRRTDAERDLFLVAGGASVQSLMIRLSAEGVGSAWISSTMFAPEIVRRHFDLNATAIPLGAIAVGHPAQQATERSARSASNYLIEP